MTLKDWQARVDDWIKRIGIRYFDPMTNTLLLVEETGEFARIISRLHGEQTFKEPMSDHDIKKRMSDELADIFFVLTCLANQHDIDLTEAIESNLQKKTERDQMRHRNNQKLRDGTNT